MLIIKARCDKAQEIDGSRDAVTKVKVSETVHVNSMCCCADNKERSPMDEELHISLRSFFAVAHSYFPIFIKSFSSSLHTNTGVYIH